MDLWPAAVRSVFVPRGLQLPISSSRT